MSSRRELGVCSRWEYEDEKALVLICKTYFHPDDQDKQACKGSAFAQKPLTFDKYKRVLKSNILLKAATKVLCYATDTFTLTVFSGSTL